MDTSAPIAVSPLLHADKSAADTPALLVDLDALEANIATIAEACRRNGINWRPHTKGIKVPQIARKLIDAGAIGLTCAKLGEAEVMAAAGFSDILIANQIVGPQKIARLVALRRGCDVIVAVDDRDNVLAIAEAARAAGVIVRLVIEVDMGMRRAGVEPGEACVALAKFIAAQQGVQVRRPDGLGRPDRRALPMRRRRPRRSPRRSPASCGPPKRAARPACRSIS